MSSAKGEWRFIFDAAKRQGGDPNLLGRHASQQLFSAPITG